MSTRHRNSGYTLIEVLVAMVILALALGVLLRIFSGGLRNISVSADYARAVLIAETRLNSVAAVTPLATGTRSGVTDKKFRWTQTVTHYDPFTAAAPTHLPVDAYTITVDVAWPHAGAERRVTLTGMQLGTTKRSLR